MDTAEEKCYTSLEISRETGLSYRQIDYWCRRGYFGEKHQSDHVGQGHRRVFSAQDRNLARHLSTLTKTGLTPADSLRVLKYADRLNSGEFRSQLPEELGSITIFWRLP